MKRVSRPVSKGNVWDKEGGKTNDGMALQAMATAAKQAQQTRYRASVETSRSTRDVPTRVRDAFRRTGGAFVPAVAVRGARKEEKPLTWNGVGKPRVRARKALPNEEHDMTSHEGTSAKRW